MGYRWKCTRRSLEAQRDPVAHPIPTSSNWPPCAKPSSEMAVYYADEVGYPRLTPVPYAW